MGGFGKGRGLKSGVLWGEGSRTVKVRKVVVVVLKIVVVAGRKEGRMEGRKARKKEG